MHTLESTLVLFMLRVLLSRVRARSMHTVCICIQYAYSSCTYYSRVE